MGLGHVLPALGLGSWKLGKVRLYLGSVLREGGGEKFLAGQVSGQSRVPVI